MSPSPVNSSEINPPAVAWITPGYCLVSILAFAFFGAYLLSLGGGPYLWPYTDATEYASMAVNMASGEGPLLRIGPAWFPPRLSPTTALLLLPQAALFEADASRLHLSIELFSMLTIILFWRLCLACGLSQAGALSAALILAISPGFARYSGWVMAAVPSLFFLTAMLLCAVMAEREKPRWSLIGFGLFAGIYITFRLTNLIWPAFVIALYASRHYRSIIQNPKWPLLGLLAFLIPLAALGIYQWRMFGHPLHSGYTFWLPEFTTGDGATFHPYFAFSGGNIAYYVSHILGIKSGLYTIPTFLVAVAGLTIAFRRRHSHKVWAEFILPATAAVAVSCLVFCFYRWTSPRFLLPASLLAAIGCGITADILFNRWNLSNPWKIPAAVLCAFLISLFSLADLGGDHTKLKQWQQLVDSERERFETLDPGQKIIPTALPLLHASLLGESEHIFLPNGQPSPVNEYHLRVIRQYKLEPIRIDPGQERVWHELIDPE